MLGNHFQSHTRRIVMNKRQKKKLFKKRTGQNPPDGCITLAAGSIISFTSPGAD